MATPSLHERTLQVISHEEWEQILQHVEIIKADGYGAVMIEIDNHHPSRINITGRLSSLLKLSKAKNYKPE